MARLLSGNRQHHRSNPRTSRERTRFNTSISRDRVLRAIRQLKEDNPLRTHKGKGGNGVLHRMSE